MGSTWDPNVTLVENVGNSIRNFGLYEILFMGSVHEPNEFQPQPQAQPEKTL